MNKKSNILSHGILIAISIAFFVLWNAEKSKTGITPPESNSSNESTTIVADYEHELQDARQQVSELLDEIERLRNEQKSISESNQIGVNESVIIGQTSVTAEGNKVVIRNKDGELIVEVGANQKTLTFQDGIYLEDVNKVLLNVDEIGDGVASVGAGREVRIYYDNQRAEDVYFHWINYDGEIPRGNPIKVSPGKSPLMGGSFAGHRFVVFNSDGEVITRFTIDGVTDEVEFVIE